MQILSMKYLQLQDSSIYAEVQKHLLLPLVFFATLEHLPVSFFFFVKLSSCAFFVQFDFHKSLSLCLIFFFFWFGSYFYWAAVHCGSKSISSARPINVCMSYNKLCSMFNVHSIADVAI